MRQSPSRHLTPSETVHPAVESPERRCFCIDVTCDNLLDAVKETVEEETAKLRQRRESELAILLREAVFEEQQLSAKAARFECELYMSSGSRTRMKEDVSFRQMSREVPGVSKL